MKNLLIILISILLLSSPVIGDNHKGETLYRWGEPPDFKWMGFGDKDTHPVYKGQVENGKRNGQGTTTYSNGNKYEGEWKDGEKHGQGTFTFSWGDKYVGKWKNGERNGQGTETYLDGENYVGEWKDGIRNGQGTYIWFDGTKYVGEWKNGEKWNGTQYDKDGNMTKKYVNGVEQK